MGEIANILSFDIEEWFHPEIFAGKFPREEWSHLESRVKRNTEIILKFLSKKGLKTTFFFLGWVAEKYPGIVLDAVQEGHEIASHGYAHSMITKLTPDEFRQDLRKSLSILKSLSNNPVVGYRAPTFSVTRQTQWALPIMLNEGIQYDSSVFPIHHDRYGIPDAPRKPYIIYQEGDKELWEYPMTTVRLGKFNMPCSGGGYFRLYPFSLSFNLMNRCQQENRPIIFYAHPWEFDTGLPKIKLSFLGGIRHYAGIHKFMERLDIITDHFYFTSFKEAYPNIDATL
jgi:polysaccharide deacetylase family protein (PEP-CTERM system associated)